MLLVFTVAIIYSIIINQRHMMHAIFKPSFLPYCSNRNICRPDCSCYNSEYCTVLQMEDNVRSYIIYSLNEIRDIESKGKPSSAGIPILQYDKQLEEISMCWASQCINDHSDCFATPKFHETSQSVGQIPFQKNETALVLWNNMLLEWLGGMDILNLDIMTSLPEGEKGEEMYNYAQILSDRVLFVGCGWALSNNSIIYVCSFGPRGPSQGDCICRTGLSCSKCPRGYRCDYGKPFTNLCKPVNTKPVEVPTTERKNRTKYVGPHFRRPEEVGTRHLNVEGKSGKKFITDITVTIIIILIAFIIIMVGVFVFYYICVI